MDSNIPHQTFLTRPNNLRYAVTQLYERSETNENITLIKCDHGTIISKVATEKCDPLNETHYVIVNTCAHAERITLTNKNRTKPAFTILSP